MAAAVLVWATGCGTLLGTNASSGSLPVQLGVTDTNTPNLVAYLQLVKAVNANVNPTPTEAPLNTALDGLIALASLASGFWLHKHGVTHGANLARQTALSTGPSSKP